MIKLPLFAFALATATVARAQTTPSPQSVCPAGTRYATIRHSIVKPGKFAAFGQAVAAHNAWYVAHRSKTTSALVRVVARSPGGPSLSETEVVTITRYADAPQPEHDAGWDAFTAKYRDSSDVKDEVRLCLP